MRALSRIKAHFECLTRNEINAEVLKFLGLLVSVIFAAAAMIAPLVLNETYIARINCGRLDLQNGIYSYFADQLTKMSDKLATAGTGHISFTKSQAVLLSDYARDHALKSPQYINHNLYNWCAIDYNTSLVVLATGEGMVEFVDVTTSCLPIKWPRQFSFQEELIAVGLEVIVGYAFYDANEVPRDNPEYYSEGKLASLLAPALLASVVLQIAALGMTLRVYTRAGTNTEHSNLFKAHIIAYVSLAACSCSWLALISISILCSRIRKDIYAHLHNYGMNLMFGKAWFLLVWVSSLGAFVSALVHMTPIMFGEPWAQDDEDEEDLFLATESSLYRQESSSSVDDKYQAPYANNLNRADTLRDTKFRGIFHAQRAALDCPQNENEAEELVNLGLSLYTIPFTRGQSTKYPEIRRLDAKIALYARHTEQYPTYPTDPFRVSSKHTKAREQRDEDGSISRADPYSKREKNLTENFSRATSLSSVNKERH